MRAEGRREIISVTRNIMGRKGRGEGTIICWWGGGKLLLAPPPFSPKINPAAPTPFSPDWIKQTHNIKARFPDLASKNYGRSNNPPPSQFLIMAAQRERLFLKKKRNRDSFFAADSNFPYPEKEKEKTLLFFNCGKGWKMSGAHVTMGGGSK